MTLDYFNERFNDCEIKLEREEENIGKLMTTKADLETTREQMVLLKVGWCFLFFTCICLTSRTTLEATADFQNLRVLSEPQVFFLKCAISPHF